MINVDGETGEGGGGVGRCTSATVFVMHTSSIDHNRTGGRGRLFHTCQPRHNRRVDVENKVRRTQWGEKRRIDVFNWAPQAGADS